MRFVKVEPQYMTLDVEIEQVLLWKLFKVPSNKTNACNIMKSVWTHNEKQQTFRRKQTKRKEEEEGWKRSRQRGRSEMKPEG